MGEKEEADTLCIKCGKDYKKHTTKHKFIPARFCIYDASMTEE